MSKAKSKRRRKPARTPATMSPADIDIREVTKGVRKLLMLYATRKALTRKLRVVDDKIRDQRKYNAQMLTDPNPERRNVGELPIGDKS